MKLFFKITMLFIVIICGALTIGHFWVVNPEVFPSLPASMWNWLDAGYGSTDAEQVADLEFFVTSGISAIALSLLFFLFFVGCKSWDKRR